MRAARPAVGWSPVRVVAALAVLLAVGCGSTRPVDVPPPYDDCGILVTVRPRVYIDWPLGLESIRGTAENRTGHVVDLRLYLNLVDETGAVVGHVAAFKDDFRRGTKWKFEASVAPGPPRLFDLSLFPEPPHYTRVARGFMYDDNSVAGFAAYVFALASLLGDKDK